MSFLDRVRAAVNAYQGYDATWSPGSDRQRYRQLWAWYAGEWWHDPRMRAQQTWQPSLYRNTRQVWRQASAIVNFYDQFVYEGDLSTNGEPLSDGTRGAIPIDPQTGSDSTDKQLVVAIHQLFAMWRYQQHMSVAPRLCAALGDCLTEIVDDYKRGMVYPRVIRPDYVPDCDLELDDLGNVKRYAIEYPVIVPASKAFGRVVDADTYLFRKEVDGETFRYYKDGLPFDYPDIGPAVQRNPYGFAPAVWERHEEVPWSNRGIAATERTLQQTMQLNSTLSHAIDYQSKQFAIPVGVVGSAVTARAGRVVTLPGGVSVTFPRDQDPTLDEIAVARQQAAEQQHLIGMDPTGKFVTADFNVGSTTEMLNLVMESILSESPEARYAQHIMTMSQVSGPGMERILAPIVGLIKAARKMHDPATEKKLQIGVTIMGYRFNNGDAPAEIVRSRPDRFAAFAPFDLTSYGKGLEDFTIPGRPVFPETPLEEAQRMLYVQQVTDPDLMLQLGRNEATVEQLTADRQAQADMQASLLTGLQSAQAQNPPPQPTGPSGASGATGAAA
jgi:hypothetical protein